MPEGKKTDSSSIISVPQVNVLGFRKQEATPNANEAATPTPRPTPLLPMWKVQRERKTPLERVRVDTAAYFREKIKIIWFRRRKVM